MKSFVHPSTPPANWRAAERLVCRFLMHLRFRNIRLVGQTSDGGADIVATTPTGLRAIIQVKHWRRPVGMATRDETFRAMNLYRAQVPIIVAFGGFEDSLRQAAAADIAQRAPLQLWDWRHLIQRAEKFPDEYPLGDPQSLLRIRDYQRTAIDSVVAMLHGEEPRRGMVVLATGLGKTFVAAEAIRRACATRPMKVLVIAHMNDLVYQLERAFWPFLRPSQATTVWNGEERAGSSSLADADITFACIDSVAAYVKSGGELPEYDLILVDECHHAAAPTYVAVLHATRAGVEGGPKLLGLTATPWHPGDVSLSSIMGQPLVSVDLVAGLRYGYLSNVEYRMFTDNIDWSRLGELPGTTLTARQINRTLLIHEWDDAVVDALQQAWTEVSNPRAIVFCGTVDHAITMRDRIRQRGFANVAALYSQAGGRAMKPFERNRLLCDFHDGIVNILCAVDILNEGVDVPDVNIVVFQRVTHSRRIFVQQLGRGLRVAEGKDRVVVLDFVSDIRRFAAGLNLKQSLEAADEPGGRTRRVRLNHKVEFRRVGGQDPQAETFLRQWLQDVAEIESSEEDVALLKFPPSWSRS